MTSTRSSLSQIRYRLGDDTPNTTCSPIDARPDPVNGARFARGREIFGVLVVPTRQTHTRWGYQPYRWGLLTMLLLVSVANAQPAPASLTHPGHAHPNPGRAALSFNHPLIAESPSPDTKLRVDYFFADGDHEDEHTIRLEAEYAFSRSLSVEVDVPYTFVDPEGSPSEDHFGNIDIGLKWASFAFEEHNLLVGGGVELVLPTGDDDRGIGSDHTLKIEPFIDLGYQQPQYEVIAFLAFGIPTNEPDEEKDEEDLELEFNLSFLYVITPHLMGLLELDGSSVVSGTDNKTVVNLTPGIQFQLPDHPNWRLGVAVSFPLSNDEDFKSQLLLSAIHHY